MADTELEERLMNIEMALANQERVIEDLNQVIIEQGRRLDYLQKQNQYLLGLLKISLMITMPEI